jgi:hypothetical protein
MSSPLAWLGGTDVEVLLRKLAGQWIDGAGSNYHLHINGNSLDVLTVRPSGKKVYTKRLIRETSGEIAWGRQPNEFTLKLDSGRLVWARGVQRFLWRKLQ